MALANSLALELAGVDADTPDIDGGEIVRDADGRPTGILKDNAMMLLGDVVPPPGDEQLERQIRAAMDYVAAQGVTTVHDMGEGFASIPAYRRLRDAGELKTRIYAVVPLSEWETLEDEVDDHGRGDAWLRATIKEKLVGETDSGYTYEIVESPLPVANYTSTFSVAADGEGTMVDWRGTFDAKDASDADAEGVIAGIYQAGLDEIVKMSGM
jgi:hypothetical protein